MKKGIDRPAVVQCACELVDREGVEALTLARLASLLDVKSPSLYNHVGSLAELKASIGLIAAQGVAEALTRAMVGQSGASAVRAGAAEFRHYILKHPGRWQALCQIPGAQIEGDVNLRAASERIIATMGAGLAAFSLADTEKIHAIRALRSLVHGFTSLELAGGFGMPVSIEESFQWMIDDFVAGLSRRLIGAVEAGRG